MTVIKAEAIILANRRFSESSLIASLFSREYGRLDVLAKGARRDKNPLAGHLDLYAREAVVVHTRPNASLDLLTEAAFLDEHAGLRFYPSAFAGAGLLSELAYAALLPGEPMRELYDVLANALAVLSALGEPAASAGFGAKSSFSEADKEALVVRAVTLALLDMLAWLGYGLELNRCVRCGKTPDPAAGTRAGLSRRHGGLVCASCRGQAGSTVGISAPALASLRDRDARTGDAAGDKQVSAAERISWLRFLVEYCQDSLEKQLKSRKTLFQMLGGHKSNMPRAKS